MKQQEGERKEEEMGGAGASGRSPNPNRQPGGGGRGMSGETTKFINTGTSKKENPNAHLKDKL